MESSPASKNYGSVTRIKPFPQTETQIQGNNKQNIGSSYTDFKILGELGRGSYGVVNKIQSKVDGGIYVMKKINIKHIKQKYQKEALKEAQILRKVRHPNIIKYHTSFVEEDHLYIIMEYAEGGDLQLLIKQHKERKLAFSEKEIWVYAWELCQAVDYLHKNNIIHRDIKTLNIFLTKDKRIKLGDLGVSKIVSSAASLQGTRVGTPLYLAPELVKQQPYDFKVDIWAVGCVLYHLGTLEPPFYGENLITLGYNIVHKNPKSFSTQYSSRLLNLVFKFLEKNPSSRPRIGDVLEHFPSKLRSAKLKPQSSTDALPLDKVTVLSDKAGIIGNSEPAHKLSVNQNASTSADKNQQLSKENIQDSSDKPVSSSEGEREPVAENRSSQPTPSKRQLEQDGKSLIKPSQPEPSDNGAHSEQQQRQKMEEDGDNKKTKALVRANSSSNEQFLNPREPHPERFHNANNKLSERELIQVPPTRQAAVVKRSFEKVNENESTVEAKPRTMSQISSRAEQQGNESTLSVRKSEFTPSSHSNLKEEQQSKKQAIRHERNKPHIIPEEHSTGDRSGTLKSTQKDKRAENIVIKRRSGSIERSPSINEPYQKEDSKKETDESYPSSSRNKPRPTSSKEIRRMMMANPLIKSSSPRATINKTNLSQLISLRNDKNFNVLRNGLPHNPSHQNLGDYRIRPVSAQVGKRTSSELKSKDSNREFSSPMPELGKNEDDNEIFEDKDDGVDDDTFTQYKQSHATALRPKSAVLHSRPNFVSRANTKPQEHISEYISEHKGENLKLKDILSFNTSPRVQLDSQQQSNITKSRQQQTNDKSKVQPPRQTSTLDISQDKTGDAESNLQFPSTHKLRSTTAHFNPRVKVAGEKVETISRGPYFQQALAQQPEALSINAEKSESTHRPHTESHRGTIKSFTQSANGFYKPGQLAAAKENTNSFSRAGKHKTSTATAPSMNLNSQSSAQALSNESFKIRPVTSGGRRKFTIKDLQM